MESLRPAEADNYQSLDPRFMVRIFYAFGILALLSIAISAGGKALGRSIAMAGHTDDASLYEIVIANHVLSVPSNAIRFERARRDGVATRLDLYLHWPGMEGYSNSTRDDFNNAGGASTILFLSFAEKIMSRDMSGRFEPVYRRLVEQPGKGSSAGLVEYRFTKESGYLDEILMVGERDGEDPYVARCLSGPHAETSLAPCERDIHLGNGLSVAYRFPHHLLPHWRKVDAAIVAKASGYLKAGG